MIQIKKSNYWAIHDFVNHSTQTILQGSKLEALHRLIQNKGEPMETEREDFKGVKVLDYSNGKGSFIGLIVTQVKKDSFYPCKIKTISLQQL